ncbi:unnamed protein product [Leptosia nina]|uniref:Uncharacterized protein n=1 Tax=Leptosia nina TaxID=320188 RepID=A0AAV1JIR8_9NEOP
MLVEMSHKILVIWDMVKVVLLVASVLVLFTHSILSYSLVSFLGSDTSKLFGTYRWLADGDCPRTQSLRSLVASDRGKYNRQFNRFKECVDGQSSQRSKTLHKHKHSRSDGSCYQDDHDRTNLDTSSTSIMGSESNLYNMKLTESANFKTQSNPEISSINSENVIFTIGDEERLLKISSNNDDVAEICSAITDYCAKTNIQNFDVVNHMKNDSTEATVDMEDLCATCDRNDSDMCNLECSNNVGEVIVIPSAEAIIGDNDNNAL